MGLPKLLLLLPSWLQMYGVSTTPSLDSSLEQLMDTEKDFTYIYWFIIKNATQGSPMEETYATKWMCGLSYLKLNLKS